MGQEEQNIALTCLFIKAGGEGNHKHKHPMLQLLTSVRKEIQQVTHLNNQKKNKELSKKGIGWGDTLDKAEELCCSMTIEGNVCWPPACNINDSQTPPKRHGTNLGSAQDQWTLKR